MSLSGLYIHIIKLALKHLHVPLAFIHINSLHLDPRSKSSVISKSYGQQEEKLTPDSRLPSNQGVDSGRKQ